MITFIKTTRYVLHVMMIFQLSSLRENDAENFFPIQHYISDYGVQYANIQKIRGASFL